MNNKRLSPHDRRRQLVRGAVEIATEIGLFNPSFSIEHVAAHCGCSATLIKHYFTNLDGLRDAAIESGNKEMVYQAKAAKYEVI